MPVTAPTTSFIFCEGKNHSYDYRLLDRLLASSGPQIVPGGGKYSLKAFIDGFCSAYSEPSFIAFRDRDFDIKPPDDPALLRIKGQKSIWTTYRACLENYLVAPDLFCAFWQAKSSGPNWQFGGCPERKSLEDIIIESAKELSAYQAVRWALADLKPGDRWPEIRTTWLRSSGELPRSFDYNDCLAEARELVKMYLEEIQNISIQKLEETAQEYRELFSKPEFYQNGQHLIWFHGKDLVKAICRKLHDQFPCTSYLSWAVNNFDIDAHPDLVDLRAKCKQL